MSFKLHLNFCWPNRANKISKPTDARDFKYLNTCSILPFRANACRNEVLFRLKIRNRTDRTTFRYFATRRDTEDEFPREYFMGTGSSDGSARLYSTSLGSQENDRAFWFDASIYSRDDDE